MKTEMNNSCKNCEACKRIYRKFGYRFWRFDIYYCSAFDKVTNSKSVCQSWRQKQKIVYDFSPRRFDSVEKDIKRLISYLKNAK